MRIFGYLLLLVGVLLCVTISWAAIGFFSMGFGLIFLLIVDNRKRAAKVAVRAARATPAHRASLLQEVEGINLTRSQNRWSAIVGSDPDVAAVVTILSGYGQPYVDQLARVYVIFEDKSLLPKILDLIITSAKRHVETTSEMRNLPEDLVEPISPTFANTNLGLANMDLDVSDNSRGNSAAQEQTLAVLPGPSETREILQNDVSRTAGSLENIPKVSTEDRPEEHVSDDDVFEEDALRRLLEKLTLDDH